MQVTLGLRVQQNSMLKHPEHPRAVEERPNWPREQLYLHPVGFTDIIERIYSPAELQK